MENKHPIYFKSKDTYYELKADGIYEVKLIPEYFIEDKFSESLLNMPHGTKFDVEAVYKSYLTKVLGHVVTNEKVSKLLPKNITVSNGTVLIGAEAVVAGFKDLGIYDNFFKPVTIGEYFESIKEVTKKFRYYNREGLVVELELSEVDYEGIQQVMDDIAD